MTIVAAADGSALGNPGAAGWAWYISDQQWRSGGWKHGTNNQAELMAVLSLLAETAELHEQHLHVLCDSQYVIRAITEWLPGWKARKWRKADGKPVLNRDLIERIDQLMIGRNVTFEWVRGHTGHPMNEKVDDLARDFATHAQRGTNAQTGPGFSATSETPTLRADGSVLSTTAAAHPSTHTTTSQTLF